jgi:hypothetical protein
MATNDGGAWRQWTSTQVAEWLVGAGFAQYAEVRFHFPLNALRLGNSLTILSMAQGLSIE